MKNFIYENDNLILYIHLRTYSFHQWIFLQFWGCLLHQVTICFFGFSVHQFTLDLEKSDGPAVDQVLLSSFNHLIVFIYGWKTTTNETDKIKYSSTIDKDIMIKPVKAVEAQETRQNMTEVLKTTQNSIGESVILTHQWNLLIYATAYT